MNYKPIESAPRDGTPVRAICGKNQIGAMMYEFSARFIDGRWCARFDRDEWKPISPAPSFWRPDMSAFQ